MEDQKNTNSVDNGVQEAELDSCKKELAQLHEKFVRVGADFANFKRRVEKERMMWMNNAQKDLLRNVLSIVDDFDRAVIEHQKKERTPELDAWLSGFEMIHSAFYEFLNKSGVTEIKQVQQFDPELHEALAQIESPEHESGAIVDVMQKGFMFQDELLRPAKVAVAK